jgi:Berberine and berberine like
MGGRASGHLAAGLLFGPVDSNVELVGMSRRAYGAGMATRTLIVPPTTAAPTYERLTVVKAAYDPDNLFHVNQNIAPAKRR